MISLPVQCANLQHHSTSSSVTISTAQKMLMLVSCSAFSHSSHSYTAAPFYFILPICSDLIHSKAATTGTCPHFSFKFSSLGLSAASNTTFHSHLIHPLSFTTSLRGLCMSTHSESPSTSLPISPPASSSIFHQ